MSNRTIVLSIIGGIFGLILGAKCYPLVGSMLQNVSFLTLTLILLVLWLVILGLGIWKKITPLIFFSSCGLVVFAYFAIVSLVVQSSLSNMY